MRMLFKVYLLGQLIALPFVVGALGDVMGGSDSSSTSTDQNIETVSGLTTISAADLCDKLHGPADNAVQDDIQQLRFITAELYDEDLTDDCFAQ